MEASEKPQLPLDDTAAEGSVRALDDRLVIEALTINDGRVARVVRQRTEAGQPAVDTVATAIEIGARVLDREEVAAEVDYVKREFERLAAAHREQLEAKNHEAVERIEAEIRRAFGSEEGEGRLSEAFQAHTRAMDDAMERTFGEEGVPREIRDLIEQSNQAFLGRLSADDELNPLRPLLTSVNTALRERRESQDTRDEKLEKKLDDLLSKASEAIGLQRAEDAVAEAEEAGTRKGRTFEDRVHDVIDEIATARGDVAHHVGDVAGETRGKKGDTVVEIGAAGGPALAKIAFDPKDSQLTRPKAWEVLNGALDDRGAGYAVLVVASEDNVPAKTQSLVEYEGNKLIIAVDPEEPERLVLETAYCLARARALAAGDDELALDAVAMREAVDEARRALESVGTARRALTGMRKNADSVEDALAAIESGTKSGLARVDALIKEALESAA